ncbi:MAG: CBS domain-containing protein [Myxococcales bacterium]|nr:CBS domain-containing protein [Myxococcales bacterium]
MDNAIRPRAEHARQVQLARASQPATESGPSVSRLMCRDPVLVDFRMRADVARRLLRARGVHFALVARDRRLFGVVFGEALEAARPFSSLEEIANRNPPRLLETDTLERAAKFALETGADGLPVMAENGELVGVLTRRQLRTAGFLPGERGIDLCSSCGSTHDLDASTEGAPAFCLECLRAIPSDTLNEVYGTLGGSG